MTIIEAIERSKPIGKRKEYLAIRRMCWYAGRRIQWDEGRSRWKFGNMFQANLLTGERELDLAQSQGCLSPESMTAIDWEVVL